MTDDHYTYWKDSPLNRSKKNGRKRRASPVKTLADDVPAILAPSNVISIPGTTKPITVSTKPKSKAAGVTVQGEPAYQYLGSRYDVKSYTAKKETIVRRPHSEVEAIEHDALRELGDMLSYKRGAYSASEQEFIERYVDSLPGMQTDSYGNRYIIMGDTPPRIMFSCHTDTVHHASGRQQVLYDPHLKHLFKADGMPLGADDGVGVWLMTNMIKAGIGGLYMFHLGEEIGGQGSSYVAEYEMDRLMSIEMAIAFDRRGTQDVITHQAGSRCCSDKFAKELAGVLGMKYQPNSGGIFTDTANYTHLISECTNLSVGYYNEHTRDEFLDLTHAENLLAAVLAANWESLQAYRDPSVIDDDDWSGGYLSTYGVGTKIGKRSKPAQSRRVSYDALVEFVHNNPVAAADILYDFGATRDDLDYATQFYKRNK